MKSLVTALLIFLTVNFASAELIRIEGGGIDNPITEDMTLTNDNDYLLVGGVFIGNDRDETVLTIEAGTTIYATADPLGMLVIRRGSKIMAEGTREAPIVFTSDAEEPDRGDWGGLIICGRAHVNTETGFAIGEGGTGEYGGGRGTWDDHDNSGVLRYVRVEYSGRLLSEDNELNGIAFQGVGDGTILEYCQAYMTKDDGFEFYGGSVNARHMIATGTGDDNFDWTEGWNGKGQFFIVQQYPEDGDNGFEADNNAEDNDAQPRAMPTIFNFTLVGSGIDQANSDDAMLLREGTGAHLYNGIVLNWGEAGVKLDQIATYINAWDVQNNRLNGNLVVNNTIFFHNLADGFANNPQGAPFTTDAFVHSLNANNRFTDPLLVNANSREEIDLRPGANSPARQGTMNPPDDGWFWPVDFVGAVDPDNDWTVGWTREGTFHQRNEVVIEGGGIDNPLTGNIHWTADNVYILRGGVFIGNDVDESILTIDAGTVIRGSADPLGMLVIRRGSKIMAEGTAAAPIVFTSDAEEPDRGDWGGLIICGRAHVNTETGFAIGEGGTGEYGGGRGTWDDHDNSGVLRYVRVEYSGRLLSEDNELNGIAFQGVGDETIVEYCQAYMTKDDGFEFFGGTVNTKYMVTTGTGDDNFDWTEGWTGKGQFWIVQQYSEDGDNGFEGDNNAEDNDALPRAMPQIYNFTLIGSGSDQALSDDAMLIREGTAGHFHNGIIANWGEAGIKLDQIATYNNAWDAQNNRLNGNLVVDHCIFYRNLVDALANNPEGAPFTTDAFIHSLNAHNRFTDAMLMEPFNRMHFDLTPMAGSPALANYAVAPEDGFFERANYVGAIGTGMSWASGWTHPGTYQPLEIETEEGSFIIPDAHQLLSSYPNPFNPTVTIEYNMPIAQKGAIRVYSLTGQLVATLAEGSFDMGRSSVVWNAEGVAAGNYLVRLEAQGFTASRLIALMK